MNESFGIQIEDESVELSEFVVDQNISFLQLHEWQREAIEFFMKHKKGIFEVATGCLTGDTLISLPDSDLNIIDIPIKDLCGYENFDVQTFNIEKEIIEFKKAKKVWLSKENVDVYEITTMNNKKIKATKNHPFLISELLPRNKFSYKYVNVENLKKDMFLTVNFGEDFIGRDKVFSIKYIGKQDVYDMEVEDNHNFIANDIIVHNSGKTFFAIEIIKRLWVFYPDMKVLVIVPKNVILETGWYKELYDAGVSLVDIGVYYGNIKEYGKITITNMQNIHKIALDIFDMCIVDELHNFGTRRLLPYLQHPFKYKMGLSATLERMDMTHYKMMDYFDYKIFRYTPKDALNDGVLNAFNFINVGVIMDKETYSKYELITEELNAIMVIGGGFSKLMRSSSPQKLQMLAKMNERKELVNNYFRKFDVVKLICEKHKKDKIIIFNEYNSQTNRCYWYLLDLGLKACIVHSGIPNDKRQQNLTDFKKDKFNVMLTSKVLDEGYNLPKIDTAIIMAGNSTSRQTIQRMGRVLRKKEKESMLYQIYCVDTIEEKYGLERSKVFKDLSSDYREYTYDGEKLI